MIVLLVYVIVLLVWWYWHIQLPNNEDHTNLSLWLGTRGYSTPCNHMNVLPSHTSLSPRICSYFIDIQHLREDMMVVWWHFASNSLSPITICIITNDPLCPCIEQLKLRHKFQVTVGYSLFPLALSAHTHSSFTCYLWDSTKIQSHGMPQNSLHILT